MIMNRRNFEYNLRHTLNYFLRCNNRRNLRSLKAKANMRDLYLNKGINYLAEDLDIVQFLQMRQNF